MNHRRRPSGMDDECVPYTRASPSLTQVMIEGGAGPGDSDGGRVAMG